MENKAIARIEQFAKKISESLWNESGTGRAAVMVGAGFSMNAVPLGDSKMLSWNQLVSCMREELNLDEEYQPDALELAELYEAEFGRQKLEQFLERKLPDKNMVPGALHKKLLNLPWSDVFTTNYDTLLERTADEITKYRCFLSSIFPAFHRHNSLKSPWGNPFFRRDGKSMVGSYAVLTH
ncbi:hypothetical protein [Selenomonas ruminantium]|uniref:hypothetical protein n=1 Tax=Selenomonas ruminantium TaxID=971 RepID=UPI0026EFD83C|nr:hypothetical protein [Selenomonas ruminantium]